MLSVKLSKLDEKRLEVLTKKTRKTREYYLKKVKKAVTESLEDMEDLQAALEALKNPGKRYSMKEVEEKLGLGNWMGQKSP